VDEPVESGLRLPTKTIEEPTMRVMVLVKADKKSEVTPCRMRSS
jgi:hypothetical protein